MDSLFFINLASPGPSRYSLENLQNFVNGGYDPISSSILLELKNITSGGQYTIQGQESRPDQIANDIYGDTQYWWVIMAYNDLIQTSDLINGLQIEFPRADLLEDFYFGLKAKQDSVTP